MPSSGPPGAKCARANVHVSLSAELNMNASPSAGFIIATLQLKRAENCFCEMHSALRLVLLYLEICWPNIISNQISHRWKTMLQDKTQNCLHIKRPYKMRILGRIFFNKTKTTTTTETPKPPSISLVRKFSPCISS